MEPVEVLVSEFLTGLGLGDGVRGGLDWRGKSNNKVCFLLCTLANVKVTMTAVMTPRSEKRRSISDHLTHHSSF